jgi:hypothetical protein
LGKVDPAVIAAQLASNHKLEIFKLKLFFVMSIHWAPYRRKGFWGKVAFSLRFL